MEFSRGDGDNIGTGYGGGYGWWGSMWVLALVIIFFALIFWGRREEGYKHNYADAIMPAMAVGAMEKNKDYAAELTWDCMRDNLREFANLRQEVSDKACMVDREMARYFYETRAGIDKGFYEQRAAIDRNNYDTALGFKQSEIGNLVQTKEILGRIDKLENGMKEEKIQALLSKVNFLETVQGVRGWGIPPAWPVAPPQPFPFTSC